MIFKKTTLKNGLRIITVPVKNTQTASVVVMVGVGSRFEEGREAGLSHFIEHMLFKGTTKRPTTLDISKELDAIGGEFNAFTSKDKTMYFAKADAKHINTTLDVIADMYLNSRLEPEEIEKEKGTIIQEINMYEDTPMRRVSDIFEETLYEKNSLGRDIAGDKKTVSSFERGDFVRYMQKHYVASDTVVCVAGKINEKDVLKKIKNYFGEMKKGRKAKLDPVLENQKNPQVKIKFKKTDQTHLVFGVRSYKKNHPNRFALSLLSIILGGNMSSRLFIEVRERRGLAYYVRTGVETYEDCGYLATQAGVEHKNLEITLKTILAEYKKISEKEVSQEELRRAKDYIKGKTVMGMESSDEVALFLTEQEVSRRKMMTPQEIFQKIEKVTSKDILRVAQDVFQKNKFNLTVIGPHKDNVELKNILNS